MGYDPTESPFRAPGVTATDAVHRAKQPYFHTTTFTGRELGPDLNFF